MAKGKFEAPKRQSRTWLKVTVVVMTLVLVIGCSIGGTLAWLQAEADPVVNTFTYGDIDIGLEETPTDLPGEGDDDDDDSTNYYEMVPGETISKDPKVTVLQGSEDCWLFVKIETSENFDEFMTYEMADGWTVLDAEQYPGVYFREVSQDMDADQEFTVIKDNTVQVRDEVTKEMLNALDDTDPPEYPTLTVSAYAVQRNLEIEAIDTAAEAWALIQEKANA